MSLSADDAAFQEPEVADFAPHIGSSRTPVAFVNALRHGTPDSRHNITVNGAPAQITIVAPAPPAPRREAACFSQLRLAMAAAITDEIQPQLPPEISMVVWRHEGRELRVCAPGTAAALRRTRGRLRRGLSALSPFPLLGAITQPLAGSATAVGIAVAPVLPPVHQPTVPPSPVVRPITGEIARPPLPYSPGTVTPPPWTTRPAVRPPKLVEFTAPDTAPSPVPPPIRDVPSPPTGSGLRAPTAPVTEEPTPAATDEPTATASPSTSPSPEPTSEDTPSPEPTATQTTTASATATVSAEPHRKHHMRRNRHHTRGHR